MNLLFFQDTMGVGGGELWIADATGARIDNLPFTPERVWRALNEQ